MLYRGLPQDSEASAGISAIPAISATPPEAAPGAEACTRRGQTLVAETLVAGWGCAKKTWALPMMPILSS
jgi:hypothetical protein